MKSFSESVKLTDEQFIAEHGKQEEQYNVLKTIEAKISAIEAAHQTLQEAYRSSSLLAEVSPSDDAILRLAAKAMGNPMLYEDLKGDFPIHTEAEDWINFARVLLAAPTGERK
jgi:hypothetical protein